MSGVPIFPSFARQVIIQKNDNNETFIKFILNIYEIVNLCPMLLAIYGNGKL